jgi:pyruvate/2-oxoglutarate dehydrogenase complex dihydrolipoamide acyltransferase (E2) component
MVTKVVMPKLSLTMKEGTVGKWYKNEGDNVENMPNLSHDHRVVDGVPAAQFLCAKKDYIEKPEALEF